MKEMCELTPLSMEMYELILSAAESPAPTEKESLLIKGHTRK